MAATHPNDEVARLIDELLTAAAAQGLGQRALAREAGISESLPGTWRSGRSGPRLGYALAAGAVVGLRLDWESETGDEQTTRTAKRPAVTWQASRRGAPPLVVDPDEDDDYYIAQLLGAELHWRHTQIDSVPLSRASEASHGTWSVLEHGGGRDLQDSLVRSYVAAGAAVDLRLAWVPADAAWRAPWNDMGALYRTP